MSASANEQESDPSAQSSTATSSILRGIDLIGQPQQSANARVHIPRQNNNSLVSISNNLLSNLNSTSSNQTPNQNDETSKKKKKHKHHHKEKSSKNHKKKRRHDATIAHNSAIALATAENIVRYNSKDHHSHRHHRSSSSRPHSTLSMLKNYPSDNVARTVPNNGHSASSTSVIPSQFINYPFSLSQPPSVSSVPPSASGVPPPPVSYLNGLPVSSFSILHSESTLNPSGANTVLSSQVATARGAAPPVLITGPGVRGPSFSETAVNPVLPFPSNPPSAAPPPALQHHLQSLPAEKSTDEGNKVAPLPQSGGLIGGLTGQSEKQPTTATRTSASKVTSNNASLSLASRICSQSVVTNVSIEDLRALFHLTLVDASKQLGMCTTLFKKICRKKNIEKWPYRKIHSLMSRVESLQQYLAEGEATIPEGVKKSYSDQIAVLMDKINTIKEGYVELPAPAGDEEGSNPSLSSLSSSSLDQTDGDSTSSGGETHVIGKDQNTAKRKSMESSQSSSPKVSSNEDNHNKHSKSKRARHKTSYDLKTGWVANCSTCGKVGKYRHPTQGRVFQHSSGTGKYCGYFRDNPRNESSYLNGESGTNSNGASSVAVGATNSQQDRMEVVVVVDEDPVPASSLAVTEMSSEPKLKSPDLPSEGVQV